MTAHAAKQPVTGTRRPAVPASGPILASKITVPNVPEWAVRRARISELIAQGTRWCPLTVITGPAGVGKTMALALWAAAEPGPVAWVSLEQHDNRPAAFWAYVTAALRSSGAAVPRQLLAAPRKAADHAFLLRLAAALAAQDPPVRLVLDDLHLLTGTGVLNGLDFLLRNVGPGLRLVVASRMGPGLRLHRYRLAGELAELQAGDLAFMAAEAAQLMAKHGCTLAADSLESLVRRTEGWAAGLRLAAISIAACPHPGRSAAKLLAEDGTLARYLIAETVDTQPPEARDLLFSTSILEQVNAGLAVALTGRQQAGQTLSDLARANAFVQPIGGGWYRYHTLFAEVLCARLRREHPDRAAALHRRAAEWYKRNGKPAEPVGETGPGRPPASAIAGQVAAPAPAKALAPVMEPLTDREREVLRHASGLLNTAEIAREMYISVNTVKAHLKSVHRKLVVARRGEAVRRARQLQLI
jgi:LuxR family maltose regulon positive regulatory protein